MKNKYKWWYQAYADDLDYIIDTCFSSGKAYEAEEPLSPLQLSFGNKPKK